jgi:hypothetical protein
MSIARKFSHSLCATVVLAVLAAPTFAATAIEYGLVVPPPPPPHVNSLQAVYLVIASVLGL